MFSKKIEDVYQEDEGFSSSPKTPLSLYKTVIRKQIWEKLTQDNQGPFHDNFMIIS